ncbi:MAG: hypothetical protein ABSB74_15025 [Tepidisphaeraceae bacterium]|jgi:hypothetical protein
MNSTDMLEIEYLQDGETPYCLFDRPDDPINLPKDFHLCVLIVPVVGTTMSRQLIAVQCDADARKVAEELFPPGTVWFPVPAYQNGQPFFRPINHHPPE